MAAAAGPPSNIGAVISSQTDVAVNHHTTYDDLQRQPSANPGKLLGRWKRQEL